MSDSATITVTLTPQMAGQLAEIAARERSTPDAEAGRILPQAEVMRDIRTVIDAARAVR